ncbi:early nodulin-like protein 9 [Arachis stenosperma]|uniref:early nodulin-like protein 9 n=1 Tax=Arachis stenosperma TaxID=217475 RepID=UPI0025AC7AA6|nr:early nodulin-like protein 9 [Arachis stenosperma]
MATSILRSNKVVHSLGLLCVLLLVHEGAAYDFIVGGQKGWSVPSDSNFNPFNSWAEKSRFQIGDSLVFNYQSGQDSVLQVKSEDYASCNTNSPYAKFSDGHTVFKLTQSGPYFFISGNKDNCLKNEKLTVIVMADRTNRTSSTASPTSSPPWPQPPSAPSPAPTGQEGQSSPPPAGTVETNPTPAPSSEGHHPPNAAASAFVNFAASLVAISMASSALMFSL